jgi:HAD superfamily hydrolase (TIGR01509 family)
VSERARADEGSRFRAVVFDMDGVLTDSEPAFHAAFNDILARYGKHIAVDEYKQIIGMATPDSWTHVIEMKDLPLTLDEALAIYETPLMARLREPRPPLPHARELIATLRSRGVPVALCTASYSRWADAILSGAGLAGMFDALSTADMVERTKPDAAPYLLAAEKLGVAPGACIAVEDSTSGLKSAMAAGMHVIQLRATATAAAPMTGVAGILDSLADFPLHLVAKG